MQKVKTDNIKTIMLAEKRIAELELINEQIIKDLVVMVDRLSNLSLEFYDLSKKYNQIIGDAK